ncbi:MAG: hypothetical protein AVDCRST_MAG71-2723, partial [uncultured Lysobacter sp.]
GDREQASRSTAPIPAGADQGRPDRVPARQSASVRCRAAEAARPCLAGFGTAAAL